MAGLSLQQVRKVFDGGQVAVAGASFDAANGELLVLVGPSGCGKSTLLRLIAGLETATSGSIHIGERDVTHLAPRDRDIAMVFQNYALYPHMTVAENLSFGLRLRNQSAAIIEQRLQSAADLLGLKGLLQRRPAQLSGGQRQRVALGRALVRQPAIFLLDEPLSNLDAKLRASVRTEIARLHRSLKATMVYVTHDQVEAMTLGQRIVVMKDGEIQQIDTPMAIYRQPANLFVAGFLGSPAMNFMKGACDGAGAVLLDHPQGRIQIARVDAGQGTDRELVFGLRPEALHRTPQLSSNANLDVVTEVVESVGSEAFIYAKFGAQDLVVRTAPDEIPPPGSRMRLHFATSELHFFDPATGQRLVAHQRASST